MFRDLAPYTDPNLGWGRFVRGKIESYEMPVSANDARGIMREPTVGLVAEKIEEHLSRKSAFRAAAAESPVEARLRSTAS